MTVNQTKRSMCCFFFFIVVVVIYPSPHRCATLLLIAHIHDVDDDTLPRHSPLRHIILRAIACRVVLCRRRIVIFIILSTVLPKRQQSTTKPRRLNTSSNRPSVRLSDRPTEYPSVQCVDQTADDDDDVGIANVPLTTLRFATTRTTTNGSLLFYCQHCHHQHLEH